MSPWFFGSAPRAPLPPPPAVDDRPLEPKAGFRALITAAFGAGALPWPDVRDEPPALARAWWSQPPGPAGSREAVWVSLAEEGTRMEIDGWSECGAVHWLETEMARIVVEHQNERALIEPGDPIPAPWTASALQAAAALWNIGYLAVAIAEDAAGAAGVERRRAQVREWFSLLPRAAVAWGDLILFHRLAPAIGRWTRRLDAEITDATTAEAEANAHWVRMQQEAGAVRWFGRAPARRRTADAERLVSLAHERTRKLRDARAWTEDAGRKWIRADAIGRLPAMCAPDVLALPPPPPTVDGLDLWAVREAAHRCPHTPASLVTDHAVLRTVFGERLRADAPPDASDGDAVWRDRRLVLEFYRIWFAALTGASPDPSTTVLQGVPLGDDAIESYARFFEPWDTLKKAHAALSGVRPFGARWAFSASAERAFREMGAAFETLRVDLSLVPRGPIRPADFAGWDARTSWFRQHLAAIGLEGYAFGDEAWPRLLELARFYRRWGELTATARAVRETRATPGSDGVRALLLPWCRLRAANEAIGRGGSAVTGLQREFVDVYRMPEWIGAKLDDLWEAFRGAESISVGAAS
jgi:hypothetical protein